MNTTLKNQSATGALAAIGIGLVIGLPLYLLVNGIGESVRKSSEEQLAMAVATARETARMESMVRRF